MLAAIYQTIKQDHNHNIYICVRTLNLTYYQMGLSLNMSFFCHLFIALYHASHWKLNHNVSTLHVFDSHIYWQAFGNVIRNHRTGNQGLLYIYDCVVDMSVIYLYLLLLDFLLCYAGIVRDIISHETFCCSLNGLHTFFLCVLTQHVISVNTLHYFIFLYPLLPICLVLYILDK